MNSKSDHNVEIIPYEEEYKEDFRKINYGWIEQHFEVTDLDRKAFNNPQAEILDKGGFIFLARIQGLVVGSVALEKIKDSKYALTRMGVYPEHQGKKIGQALMDAAIGKAIELRASSVVLYTNQQLVSALNLYFKNGFRVVPLDNVPYKRATIKMELILSN
jgi:ribosomal protein S18 acetylase RimI-like enzyme